MPPHEDGHVLDDRREYEAKKAEPPGGKNGTKEHEWDLTLHAGSICSFVCNDCGATTLHFSRNSPAAADHIKGAAAGLDGDSFVSMTPRRAHPRWCRGPAPAPAQAQAPAPAPSE